jgi:hypothetical protein
MQLVQGKDPLHRFLEARHVVQAVLARRRFAGWTLGRPMMESEVESPGSSIVRDGSAPRIDKRRSAVFGPTLSHVGKGTISHYLLFRIHQCLLE